MKANLLLYITALTLTSQSLAIADRQVPGVGAIIVNCTHGRVIGTAQDYYDSYEMNLGPNSSTTYGCINCNSSNHTVPLNFNVTNQSSFGQSSAKLENVNQTPLCSSSSLISACSVNRLSCPAQEGLPSYILWIVKFSDNTLSACGQNIGCSTMSELAKANPKHSIKTPVLNKHPLPKPSQKPHR